MTDNTETEFHIVFEQYNKDTKNPIDTANVVTLVDKLIQIVKRKSYTSLVEDFHLTFKQVIGQTPSLPVKEVGLLRLSLILEELTELAEALGSETLTEFQRMLYKKSEEVRKIVEDKREYLQPTLLGVLDACADLQYVLSGTIVACGLHKKFDEAFEEVHRSNMSKACKGAEEAQATHLHFIDKGTYNSIDYQGENIWLCFREPDRKLLKSIGYSPANLTKFIEEAQVIE